VNDSQVGFVYEPLLKGGTVRTVRCVIFAKKHQAGCFFVDAVQYKNFLACVRIKQFI
jgi:hypothetical protein